MHTSSPIITARGLERNFGKTRAVDSLDLSILPGELFGLVGPDGAGKTTTLRLLAGLLDIHSGSLEVAGVDVKRQPEAIKPRIGYMAQQFSNYAELTVLENLRFFSRLYDVSDEELQARTERMLSFAGLSAFKDRRGAHLSGGMQKKLALACTLIHEPDILLLDEPTTGVDPISRREFWGILTDLHLSGTTIVVSTPYMDEADRCSRVGLMFAGRLVVCDEPRAIRAGVRGEVVELRPEDWRKAQSLLESLPGIYEVQTYGERLQILVDSAEKRLPKIRKLLKREGVRYQSLRQAPVRMEQAFVSLIRTMEAEQAPSPEG